LPANIRPSGSEWQWQTLAFYDRATITAVKSFVKKAAADTIQGQCHKTFL
jgi:hypothetical protein